MAKKKSNIKKKSKDKKKKEEEESSEDSGSDKSDGPKKAPKGKKGGSKGAKGGKAPRKGKSKLADTDSCSNTIMKEFHKRGSYTDLDYWHGLLPNEDTANLLKEEGQFMLRRRMETEQTADEPILLSVRRGNNVINAIINETESGFQTCGREFESMADLVDYYQVRKEPMKVDAEDTILGNPVRRKPWELRQSMVKLIKELGSGSYGHVFLGVLTFPRQRPIEVAVKFLTEMNNEACAALWKEARVMQEFKHPNAIKIYGVANDSQPYFLVMELIGGGSVDTFLQKNPTITLAKRTRIGVEAAQGIEYLHSMGCIHRDIAARNLLIDKVTKVADFGLTRKSKNYKIDPEKPLNLRWIAPDVFETSTVTKATDVYAYGVTLYELYKIPYAIPYEKWDANEVYERVVTKGYRLAPPMLLPRELASIMRECLMDPKMRPTFKMIVVYLSAQLKLIEERGGGEYDKSIPKRLKKAKAEKAAAPGPRIPTAEGEDDEE